jgi:tetrapyrrole methylase family protein/MazG family protein
MVTPPKNLNSFLSLLEIVTALRGPDGCPWDKEQTHRSLTPFAIEEAHELAEAMESGNEGEMISELGDLLLQIILHAEIGRQEGRFDVGDVICSISEKMVRRHPHVFSDTKVADSNEVLANWSEIKAKEKVAKPTLDEAMRFDVPLSIPALTRSHKIGDKTQRLRFDWQNAAEVFAKVEEELTEVKAELPLDSAEPVDAKIKGRLEHEIGDLLFSVAQLARHLGLEAEQCLRTANTRFETRFFIMRKQIKLAGLDYDKLSSIELEAAWQTTKTSLANMEK